MVVDVLVFFVPVLFLAVAGWAAGARRGAVSMLLVFLAAASFVPCVRLSGAVAAAHDVDGMVLWCALAAVVVCGVGFVAGSAQRRVVAGSMW